VVSFVVLYVLLSPTPLIVLSWASLSSWFCLLLVCACSCLLHLRYLLSQLPGLRGLVCCCVLVLPPALLVPSHLGFLVFLVWFGPALSFCTSDSSHLGFLFFVVLFVALYMLLAVSCTFGTFSACSCSPLLGPHSMPLSLNISYSILLCASSVRVAHAQPPNHEWVGIQYPDVLG